jgi:hypothetical protein
MILVSIEVEPVVGGRVRAVGAIGDIAPLFGQQ